MSAAAPILTNCGACTGEVDYLVTGDHRAGLVVYEQEKAVRLAGVSRRCPAFAIELFILNRLR